MKIEQSRTISVFHYLAKSGKEMNFSGRYTAILRSIKITIAITGTFLRLALLIPRVKLFIIAS